MREVRSGRKVPLGISERLRQDDIRGQNRLLRERVATLAGSPAADVVRLLGHLLLFYSATRPFCYEYSQKACKRGFVGKITVSWGVLPVAVPAVT